MGEHKHHGELMTGISEFLREILDNSNQSIYVYLDDTHKICNKKFAALLGYKNPKEWSNVTLPFTDSFVDKASWNKLVTAYRKAMEKLSASSVSITWKKKNGSKVKTEMILVPFVFKGHVLAVHYIN